MSLSNPNPSRLGAQVHWRAVKIDATPLQLQGSDVKFDLTSSTPGVITSTDPKEISFANMRRPVLVTVKLVGAIVEEHTVRFPDDPHDAVWFRKGQTLPTVPGTAGGMFVPLAVSDDLRELTFLGMNIGDGEAYRARFNYTFSGSQAASASGGPIIIND